jgi:hypothetical protein
MTPEEALKRTLGEILFQNALLQARISELEIKLKEKLNGHETTEYPIPTDAAE